MAAIAENPEPPTFANTIEALELADERLSAVLGVFYTLSGTDTNDRRNELQRAFSPRLAAYGSEITNNRALFDRIETLWARSGELGLTPEQARVLMLTRRGFVRSGAALEGADRERLTAIKERLAVLGTQFTQNLLKDEASWHMALSEGDLEGLPGLRRRGGAGGGGGEGAGGAGDHAVAVAGGAVPAVLAAARPARAGL